MGGISHLPRLTPPFYPLPSEAVADGVPGLKGKALWHVLLKFTVKKGARGYTMTFGVWYMDMARMVNRARCASA